MAIIYDITPAGRARRNAEKAWQRYIDACITEAPEPTRLKLALCWANAHRQWRDCQESLLH